MILPCPTASSCGVRRGEEPFRAKEVQQWKWVGTGPKDAGAATGVNEDEGISPTIVGRLYVDMLIGWLIDWLIDRLIGWLIDWLTLRFNYLFRCLFIIQFYKMTFCI